MSAGPWGRGGAGARVAGRTLAWRTAVAVLVVIAVAALTARALGGPHGEGGGSAPVADAPADAAAGETDVAQMPAAKAAGATGVARMPAAGPAATPAREDAAAGRSPEAASPRFGFSLLPAQEEDGPPYDGRFTFLRVRFESPSGMRGGFFGRGGGGREPLWAHDMPRAERNFARILDETTFIEPYLDGGRVLGFDDPELFRYPVAYIVEVGGWRPSETEIANLRAYLLKGGFLIVDDFRGNDIYQFVDVMRRVLPDHRVVEIPDDHEIFDSFFRIDDPHALAPPTFRQYVPMYLGIFEDDDPSKRLMAVINYNNDIAEYWEYSDWGYYPIDLSNEAYKFGVNYVVYALTH